MSFKAPLAEIFAEKQAEEDMPEADPEMIERLYGRIRSAAEDMDIDELEGIFSGMSKYRIPESESALWNQLRDAVSRYDYDEITAILSEK